MYGDKLKDLKLCDNRTIFYEQRFMITTNKYQPKIYQVTKITELTPPGLFKYSIKQDELNTNRDNLDLMICDYYKDNGHNLPSDNNETLPSVSATIKPMFINDKGELDYVADEQSGRLIKKGITSYYKYSESIKDTDINWELTIIDNDNLYTDDKKQYLIGLIKIDKLPDGCISVRPGKANSLIGKKFLLTAINYVNDEYTSIELEVIANG